MLIHLTVLEGEARKNLENPGGDKVLANLGGNNAGLPFFAFADAQGGLIVNARRTSAGNVDGTNIGHPFAPEEIEWFMTMLKKAASKMDPPERKTIEDWLKNQKK